MFIFNVKKHAVTGLGLTLLFFLLLNLCGCNSSSDPTEYYQTIGSWEGTIGDRRVKGIIAVDGSYHLAVVDATGAFLPGAGEYTGVVSIGDTENNIGSMSLKFLQPPANSEVIKSVSFKLTATSLYSEDTPTVNLIRTGDANGPATQRSVAGYWSLSAADNSTDVVIDANGKISGNDGLNCRYAGTLSLIDPAWNIYSLNIVLSDLPGKFCLDADFSGLAMGLPSLPPLPPLRERSRLWFVANMGARTFLGEWTKTDNIAPVAALTILGERADQSVLVKNDGVAAVELDARGSSDVNNDTLSFEWSGTDPDGVALSISGVSSATFVPTKDGTYLLSLVVGDGITTNTLTRSLRVKWTLDRFIDCTNGTVLDTKTQLLWLKDAGCAALNTRIVPPPALTAWGVPHEDVIVDGVMVDGVMVEGAVTRVGALPYDVAGVNLVCGLTGSDPGGWHLPRMSNEFNEFNESNEFSEIIPLYQWKPVGNSLFLNVGKNLIREDRPLRYYWTGERDPLGFNSWFYVDTSYAPPADWFGVVSETTPMAVWPVRAARDEVEITQCLQAVSPL